MALNRDTALLQTCARTAYTSISIRTHTCDNSHTHVSMEQDPCLEVFRLLWNPQLHCSVHVHPTVDCILNPAEYSPTLAPCSLEFLLRIIPSSTYCSPKWSLYCEFPIQNVNSSIHFQSPVISIVLSLNFYTSIYTYINALIHRVAYISTQLMCCVASTTFTYVPHLCLREITYTDLHLTVARNLQEPTVCRHDTMTDSSAFHIPAWSFSWDSVSYFFEHIISCFSIEITHPLTCSLHRGVIYWTEDFHHIPPSTFPDLYDKCLCPLLPSLKTWESAKTCNLTSSFVKAICKSTNLFKIEVLDRPVQQVYTLNYLAVKLPTFWNEKCLDKVPNHHNNTMVKSVLVEVSSFIGVSQC